MSKTILFFTASPEDQAYLRLTKELREIQSQLHNQTNELELSYHPATRDSDLRHALIQSKPWMVHFSGHGEGDKRRFAQASHTMQIFPYYSNTVNQSAIATIINTMFSSVIALANALGQKI